GSFLSSARLASSYMARCCARDAAWAKEGGRPRLASRQTSRMNGRARMANPVLRAGWGDGDKLSAARPALLAPAGRKHAVGGNSPGRVGKTPCPVWAKGE